MCFVLLILIYFAINFLVAHGGQMKGQNMLANILVLLLAEHDLNAEAENIWLIN